MKMNILFGILALAAVGGLGAAHGVMSDRWGIPEKVKEAAQRLSQVPMNFGDWTGTEGEKMHEKTQRVAGAEGYLSRSYTNSQGDTVSVMILCGRPGPISSHSPEVCFTGSGLRQQDDEIAVPVTPTGLDESTFYDATFLPPETRPGPGIRTFWACSPEGSRWKAINDGRVEYAKYPYLYRTFLTTAEQQYSGNQAAKLIDGFLKEFLPILSTTLAPPEAPTASL